MKIKRILCMKIKNLIVESQIDFMKIKIIKD